jgi:hypothetical protein
MVVLAAGEGGGAKTLASAAYRKHPHRRESGASGTDSDAGLVERVRGRAGVGRRRDTNLEGAAPVSPLCCGDGGSERPARGRMMERGGWEGRGAGLATLGGGGGCGGGRRGGGEEELGGKKRRDCDLSRWTGEGGKGNRRGELLQAD